MDISEGGKRVRSRSIGSKRSKVIGAKEGRRGEGNGRKAEEGMVL